MSQEVKKGLFQLWLLRALKIFKIFFQKPMWFYLLTIEDSLMGKVWGETFFPMQMLRTALTKIAVKCDNSLLIWSFLQPENKCLRMRLTFIVLIFHFGIIINGFHYSMLFPSYVISMQIGNFTPVSTSSRGRRYVCENDAFFGIPTSVFKKQWYLPLSFICNFIGRVTRSTLKCFNSRDYDGKGQARKRNEKTAVMDESRWYIQRLFLKSEQWVGNFLIRQQKMVGHKL